MSYVNLSVEVAALPNGKYHIAVQSPVGEASFDADSPFTPEEIASIIPILAREKRVSRLEELNAARDFGQRLFAFLFRTNSDVGNAYFGSLLDSNESDGLRLRLSVEQAGALSQLPWEYLRDPSNDFLALSRRTPVVRYTQQLNTRPPAAVTMPLRVLVMISAPTDFPTLDVEGEWNRLQEATQPLRDKGLIELERLDEATLIALQRKLRTETFHVFHYVGHSDFDAASQQGVLVFEKEDDGSKGQVITAVQLSRELAEESTVRLVVLNSCHSANRPPADALAGISSSIVTRGIPAVVAMQFAISDGAAKAFAEEFYRALSEMIPLDAAMSEARRAIANRVGNNEWATPVLSLRAEDGVLFQPAATTEGTTAPPGETTPPRAVRHSRSRVIAWGALGVAAVALLMLAVWRFAFAPPTPTLTPTPALLPDLQIGLLRTSVRNPIPGQLFFLSIGITNAGQGDSGPFNWTWDSSLLPPVMLTSLDGHIENIPPGATQNISFAFTYGWWGAYSSQLNVDVDAQIVESDERNNHKPFQINLAREPFLVDFSLLPSLSVVEPPMTLDPHEFDNWNLQFAVNAGNNTACAAAPLTLVAQGDDDIVLTAGGDDAACKALPLSVTVLRGPVSGLVAEIIPAAAGTASFTYYGDAEGQQVIFQSPPIDVQAGALTVLTPGDTTARLIRRVDITVPNQAVQLTRLTLTPPPV